MNKLNDYDIQDIINRDETYYEIMWGQPTFSNFRKVARCIKKHTDFPLELDPKSKKKDFEDYIYKYYHYDDDVTIYNIGYKKIKCNKQNEQNKGELRKWKMTALATAIYGNTDWVDLQDEFEELLEPNKKKIMWIEEPNTKTKEWDEYQKHIEKNKLDNGFLNIADYILKLEEENERLKNK